MTLGAVVLVVGCQGGTFGTPVLCSDGSTDSMITNDATSSLGFSGRDVVRALPGPFMVVLDVDWTAAESPALGTFHARVDWELDESRLTGEMVEGDCSRFLTVPVSAVLISSEAEVEWTATGWYSTNELGGWPGGLVWDTSGAESNGGDWYDGAGRPYFVLSDEWAVSGAGQFLLAVQHSVDTEPVRLASGTIANLEE